MNAKEMEDFFPTFLKYFGLILVCVLIAISVAGYALQIAAAWPVVTGMIFYKSIKEAGGNPSRGNDEESHTP